MKEIRIACRGAEAVPWTKLVPFQGALKTLSEGNYQKFKEEIIRDGYAEPISCWLRAGEYVVLNGHQRLLTIKRMVTEEGYTVAPLPVSIVFVQNERQANELVLALTAQFGEMTNESLADFLRERGLPFKETLDRFPHRDVNPDKVLRLEENPARDNEGDDEKADEAPPVPVDPRVSPGDVFRCGEHLIVCGDSGLPEPYAAIGLDKEPADLVVTDPPYNLGSDSENFAAGVSKSAEGIKAADWDRGWSPSKALSCLTHFASPEASFYVFTSHFLFGVIAKILAAFPETEHVNFCVWSKPNPMPSLAKRHWTWSAELVVYATRKGHVFNFPEQGHALSTWSFTKSSKCDLHPTMKPVAVIEHPILHSSKPGAIVLDAFGGSGTTMIACERTGRKARLIELDPKYVRVTIERWEKLTGKKAEKL